jgi:purine-nucleoside phosphorylase
VIDEPRALHIHPTAELAERVLLPGDPGRALALAQELLERPIMFNHNRGLWGYTGVAADGEQLTIQATGMGGPSAAIVLEELIALGARRAIRVGTAGGLDPTLALGGLLVASEAIAADGTSRALGAGARIAADSGLCEALRIAADDPRCGPVVTSDLFYEVGEPRFDAWRTAGALAVEMEAAALFAVGRHRKVPVACILAISDALAGKRTRIAPQALAAAGLRAGAAALRALL